MEAQPIRIVLLGPPGAGKGTQAVILSSTWRIPHISTGEILREQVASNSDLGKRVRVFLDAGNLVPDSLIIEIIEERLVRADCDRGFLLDGFPRTIQQAEVLQFFLEKHGIPLHHVAQLLVPEEHLLERIRLRGGAAASRSDDTAEVAANRLQVYWEQTAPVASFYRGCGLLREIDGVGAVEEVTRRICAACQR